MHPIINLFQQHKNKDIDDNFIETLDALLFLSPITKEEFNATDNTKNPFSPVEILIAKLSENVRRLYAYNKTVDDKSKKTTKQSFQSYYDYSSIKSSSATQNMNNLDDLVEQQNLIYKCLNTIEPLIEFSPLKKCFPKGMLGQDAVLDPFSMFSYLGTHEFIQENNFNQHMSFIKKNIKEVDDVVVAVLSKIMLQPSKKEAVELVLEKTEPSSLVRILNTYNMSKPNQGFVTMVAQFLINPNNPHYSQLEIDDKYTIINKVFITELLDSPHFEKFISDKTDFINNLDSFITQDEYKIYFDQSSSELFSTIHLNKISEGTTIDFVIDKLILSESKPRNLLFNTLSRNDSFLTDSQKHKIYSIFKNSSFEFNQSIISGLNQLKRGDSILEFLQLDDRYKNKELLSFTLSLNTEYIQKLKPLFMNVKLSETLPEKGSSNDRKVKKI